MTIFRKLSDTERECLFALFMAAANYAYDVKDWTRVTRYAIRQNAHGVRRAVPIVCLKDGHIQSAARYLDALERGIGRSA